jgi:3'-phosphoadenosine 5'-phosphosulfate sulfotransferase (PAPS reductase)/FAD synthetase
MIDVMSFGGGVQSTAIMVLAGEGYIPMPKHWVFSDPGFEGADTYAHLERCKDYISKNGGQLDIVTTGNIEEDALTFARRRANSDVKRYASIPMYVEKHGGGAGILPRQCTSEYKIEPIEQYHRRVVMGLGPRRFHELSRQGLAVAGAQVGLYLLPVPNQRRMAVDA